MTYEKVKAELSARRTNIKHFTHKFFNDYVRALQKARYNTEHNIDTSYRVDGIKLFHEFDDIYSSKFYQYNGGCYCTFLQIVNGKI